MVNIWLDDRNPRSKEFQPRILNPASKSVLFNEQYQLSLLLSLNKYEFQDFSHKTHMKLNDAAFILAFRYTQL